MLLHFKSNYFKIKLFLLILKELPEKLAYPESLVKRETKVTKENLVLLERMDFKDHQLVALLHYYLTSFFNI